MKKILFAVVAGLASMSVFAAETDSVLAVEHITIDGTKITLPSTQKADGTVCKSYVSETHREGGKLVAKIEQSCVSPATVR